MENPVYKMILIMLLLFFLSSCKTLEKASENIGKGISDAGENVGRGATKITNYMTLLMDDYNNNKPGSEKHERAKNLIRTAFPGAIIDDEKIELGITFQVKGLKPCSQEFLFALEFNTTPNKEYFRGQADPSRLFTHALRPNKECNQRESEKNTISSALSKEVSREAAVRKSVDYYLERGNFADVRKEIMDFHGCTEHTSHGGKEYYNGGPCTHPTFFRGIESSVFMVKFARPYLLSKAILAQSTYFIDEARSESITIPFNGLQYFSIYIPNENWNIHKDSLELSFFLHLMNDKTKRPYPYSLGSKHVDLIRLTNRELWSTDEDEKSVKAYRQQIFKLYPDWSSITSRNNIVKQN